MLGLTAQEQRDVARIEALALLASSALVRALLAGELAKIKAEAGRA